MSNTILYNCKLENRKTAVDIHINDQKISKIADHVSTPKGQTNYNGKLITVGLAESHLHLDKACILERSDIEEGTLDEAVEETGKAKDKFTEADVYQRALKVIQMIIPNGTTSVRTYVETDSKTELHSLKAIQKLKNDVAHQVDLDIVAFAQNGLTTAPKTIELLKKAFDSGVQTIGGCPYKDENPEAHIDLVFELALEYDLHVDFHMDFDLEDSDSSIPYLCSVIDKTQFKNRVSIGHVTKLMAFKTEKRKRLEKLLADHNVSVCVLPATDLFLNGRDSDKMIPRGVLRATEFEDLDLNAAISSNNILNAFTPYGDGNLLRMANLYANVSQLSTDAEMDQCFEMITTNAYKILGSSRKIEVGQPADLVLWNTDSIASAVRTIPQALAGWKAGKQTFENSAPTIF
ncbi:cytosine deaminase [Nonlabens sp. Hel1_33_55]|uniref:amidohydrolase family protein n=1 Tax=Nonlabens sp. Hel1_33_55 TaxID=1336802 RepID=UPI000875B258|nr:amidohydrolase family protein [Nonlabens sp. Hel1_33_55]SCX89357.1 cytosine deaminase [Nonlabens sp. Hel1_33_55]